MFLNIVCKIMFLKFWYDTQLRMYFTPHNSTFNEDKYSEAISIIDD